jgi:hypothetical protein
MRTERRAGVRRIILVAVVLVCAFVVRAAAAAADGDTRIARIKAWYAATEKGLPKNRVVRRDLAEFAPEGAVLTAYFAGDTLRKMNVIFYAEAGRATDEFYLHSDSVYFISHVVGRYSASVYGQLIHRVQYRMYLDGDSLLRWVDTAGKDLPVTSPAADSEMTRSLAMAHIFMDCAKRDGPEQTCLNPARVAK